MGYYFVVQTLVLASCVVFSSLNVGTHCVHVVAQVVNFSVQSLNVRRQLIDFSVSIALPALAEKDKQDLIFGCEQGVD
ncbi:hypothetical protein GFJ91_19660, partial [Salmonella enterica subsp. enterica serovar Enteritidis]|nr:hypothetical protein [Salmonella enterica subsp. enterica serovar Enteritidis]